MNGIDCCGSNISAVLWRRFGTRRRDLLFADSAVFGTFKGFNEKGLEFAAEIVAPYDATMLDRPQLGQFLLIELGSQEEAALGRITRFVPAVVRSGAEGGGQGQPRAGPPTSLPQGLEAQAGQDCVPTDLPLSPGGG